MATTPKQHLHFLFEKRNMTSNNKRSQEMQLSNLHTFHAKQPFVALVKFAVSETKSIALKQNGCRTEANTHILK
jgi:hypothetical protein